MRRKRIIQAGQVPEGTTVKFQYTRAGRDMEGFVARFQGQLVAYENQCRHLPLTLDFGDNHIFTRDHRYFACQNHGALFEPATGQCVRGPCQGACLAKLTLIVKDGWVWLAG